MISQQIRSENEALSSRVTQMVVAEGYPSKTNYSPALLAAVGELNAFYAAHPEIIVENKARIRSSRNRKFRQFKD